MVLKASAGYLYYAVAPLEVRSPSTAQGSCTVAVAESFTDKATELNQKIFS